ncbi:MAG: hypothetical protein FD135_3542 [Comamonadaceae bacterium]|nr:MAG: hypothetical protein FD135_3542 [Comamonadaceae bacterium]
MQTLDTPPTRWIGRWIMAVAALHTLVGLVMFQTPLTAMASGGWWDSVGHDPTRGVAAWFMLFGGPLLALGLAIDALEQHPSTRAMPTLGWLMLLLCAMGALWMPVSGFWLCLPPGIALLRQK